jgi:hypothetical protein
VKQAAEKIEHLKNKPIKHSYMMWKCPESNIVRRTWVLLRLCAVQGWICSWRLIRPTHALACLRHCLLFYADSGPIICVLAWATCAKIYGFLTEEHWADIQVVLDVTAA